MTLFTTTNYSINALIENVDLGRIGLPEMQRPFVWSNVIVRNLFDSLYRGYPAGFLLFWETGAADLKGIGVQNERAVPQLAVVDGQQRLTSLYAVIKGAEILRSDFSKDRIRIAFNPLSERFDVADAAVLKDKSYIPDISELWKPATRIIAFAQAFTKTLSASRELSDDDVERIGESISHLYNLRNYQFVALTLGASVEPETIAEIFVRINGEGKKLNQSDFIMTLMSVYWDEGRADLEDFARRATRPSEGRASPFNHFIKPSPDQMLRATVGLALKRARLKNVYGVLRGRDAQTGLDIPERRDEQFGLMQIAQKHSLNLANWHHFLGALTLAGYRSEKMITSQTAVIFSYVLYLIGVCDYNVDKGTMRQAIAAFVFMVMLTGRYTNSTETRFEADLGMLRDLADGNSYLDKLRQISAMTLTSDFWSITLPSLLATSAARSPSLYAYQAALIKLDAKALFSPIKLASMIDPAVRGTKAAFEQHHLFPRDYLASIGIKDLKLVNQIANFAALEWPDNLKISAKPPSAYVPPLDAKLTGAEREQFYFWHALPPLWWELPYQEFLVERRVRMATVIKEAWEQLSQGPKGAPAVMLSVSELIASGESDAVEFKSTLRTNLHTGLADEKIHLSALKTIAAFLNAKGGTLLIGVADDGEVLGLGADGFANEDKMGLHLVDLIKSRIGDIFLPYIHAHFRDQDGHRVLVVSCEKGPKAAFVRDGAAHRFFVRGGNATTELMGSSITDYVKQRFG